jgi:hypothetical protein
MPQVRIAAGAQHFDAAHAQGIVFTVNDGVGFQRCVETGPTATGVEFGASIEQWTVAAFAQVGARTLFIPIHSGKRSLGSRLAGNRVFFRRKLISPFFVAFHDLFDFCAHIAPFFST